MITGKCIAANNSRDFFFTLFFLLVYTLLALNRRSQMNEIRFLYKYAGIISFCLMIWTVCLLLTDKTTNEFFLMKTPMKKEVKYKRIWDLLDGGVVSIIFPLSKKRSRVLL
ncbi:hypothetical protein NBO_514g0004 [Nosema bombycis CQ1]|nr:hypothetical protein NBO_514g0004 [Nosema bombycis CQ1]|eukprot:EOB12139.1 hypothetical protein NBO_514g0004 [Nosema bombycis CQ1]